MTETLICRRCGQGYEEVHAVCAVCCAASWALVGEMTPETRRILLSALVAKMQWSVWS